MEIQHKRSWSYRIVRPERLLALGFLIIILLGGLILAMPVSGSGGRCAGLMKGMFTATSAVCVTGLTIMDAGTQLSTFGQAVLLVLIQIGGLGFMTFATLIMVTLGKRLTLRGRVVLRDSMNQTTLGGTVRLSLHFLFLTLIIEAGGALLLMLRLIPLYGVKKGAWYSYFTAVSAFCNAGFDVFGGWRSLTHMSHDPLFLLVICVLIVLGGLGFTVILECLQHRLRFHRLSLHARLVLLLTGILILSGTLLFWLTEYQSEPFKNMPWHVRLINSLFQAVTLRTAGFASVEQAELSDSGKLLGCVYMLIGASPASTGGGIKTTTVLMLVVLVLDVVRGREHIQLLGREIPQDTARRSMAIAFIGLLLVLSAVVLISIFERGSGIPTIDLLYEVVSAFSTTGLSSANTPSLRPASQCLLMPLMYLGRVGPLTLAFALAQHSGEAAARIRFPEEKIMIG
ncbi:MAG: Trk family potassium uptake protein [Clostridia bacterium]|nr:Trk family potassium uptake protein [Clostridia bacterium]